MSKVVLFGFCMLVAAMISAEPAKQLKNLVTIETAKGKIVFQMFPDAAPKTVARISELVMKGFYDGLKFHRVVSDFVIQGGDPQGTGAGGTGVKIPAEHNNGKKHLLGTVAMARRGDDVNSQDCQFYICLAPQPGLDGKYTVFGQVTEGFEVIQKIQVGDVMKKVTME